MHVLGQRWWKGERDRGGAGRGPGVAAGQTAPVVLAGTTPRALLAFLGPVMRVSVESSKPAVTIGYRQFGTGRDLLLIAGQDATLSWWSPQLLSLLSQSHRVTIFDLPGVGFSRPDPGEETGGIPHLADVTAGLAGVLGLTNVEVVGWGMGGEIALDLAVRHPRLVAKLVLADAGTGGTGATPPAPRVVAAFANGDSTPASLSGYVFPAAEPGARVNWLRSMTEEPPDDIVAGAVAEEAEIERGFLGAGGLSAQELSSVRAKALVIAGTADRLFSPSDATALVGSLTGRPEEILVSGAGYGALFALDSAQMSQLEQFLAG
jgi:pimeloyl-ACP methyl ester carboxylesterase